MKTSELMIGDWVTYKDIQTRIAPADFGTDEGHTKWREEVKPIPLTEEILAKNGIRHQYGMP